MCITFKWGQPSVHCHSCLWSTVHHVSFVSLICQARLQGSAQFANDFLTVRVRPSVPVLTSKKMPLHSCLGKWWKWSGSWAKYGSFLQVSSQASLKFWYFVRWRVYLLRLVFGLLCLLFWPVADDDEAWWWGWWEEEYGSRWCRLLGGEWPPRL